MTPEAEAVRLLRGSRFGVLSTQSKRHVGYPFGSVVPYCVEHDGSLAILISRLAEHTRNVAVDARVSLTVFEQGTDVQAQSRITVLGNCACAEEDVHLRARYLRLFPRAADYLNLDFMFHRIELVAARYIGGFGTARWISRVFIGADAWIKSAEESIVARANDVHASAVTSLCARLLGRPISRARFAGIDCDGADVHADDQLLRIEFPARVDTQEALERAVAARLQACSN